MKAKNYFPKRPFSGLYDELKDFFFLIKEEERKWIKREPRKEITERMIQCLWQTRYLKEELSTVEGQRLKIIFPGWRNLESGPDFHKAEICVDEQRHKGDVEIHLFSSDWVRHGHHKDVKYNNVILHAILWKDKEGKIFKGNNQAIPELELYHFLPERLSHIQDHPDEYLINCPPLEGDCAKLISSMEKGRLAHLLDIMGDERILSKAARFRKLLWGVNDDYNEVIYHGIMEALGYKGNEPAFVQIAKRLPLKSLKKIFKDDKSFLENAKKFQAVLLGLGGFLIEKGKPDELSRIYLKTMLELWQEVEIAPEVINWQPTRIRPINHPARRLVWISYFLAENIKEEIIMLFLKLLPQRDADNPKHYLRTYIEFQRLLTRRYQDDYWLYRYKIGGKILPKPVNLMGSERAKDIIINIIIPILLVYAREKGIIGVEMEKILHSFYISIPKIPENSLLRSMRERLFGAGVIKYPFIDKANRQQGLLQIFKDYCSKQEGSCKGCDFLNILGK